jgi:hypothetical protein
LLLLSDMQKALESRLAALEEQAQKSSATAPPESADDDKPFLDDIWTSSTPVKVEGDTLRTWPIADSDVERVQVSIKGEGRPLDAKVELWHTPSYIPTVMDIYTEDGSLRPFNAVIATPKRDNTVAVFNTGSHEFPFTAAVAPAGSPPSRGMLSDPGAAPQLVQGGQIVSWPCPPSVRSVQIFLKTEMRNLKATIELTQGPNNIKQGIKFYSSDGYKRPLFVVIDTPGPGDMIRIINGNTVEFPFYAWVQPYEVNDESDTKPVVGGSGFSSVRPW